MLFTLMKILCATKKYGQRYLVKKLETKSEVLGNLKSVSY